MIIAATSTLAIGRFTVHVRPRFDNPAWAVYIILLGERLIGKQFSVPSESDCQWLEVQGREKRVVYAKRPSYGRRYSIPSRKSVNPFATARNATPKRETEPA